MSLEKLPDSVGGAYLFRVDADKAIEKATGIRIAPGIDPPCKFEWDAARGTFEQK